MAARCYRCVRPVPQAFPCFVCAELFCLMHVFEHACVRDRPPLLHFVEPKFEPRSKLSLVQYSTPKGPDSTVLLALINARQSVSGWSGDSEDLSGAHHIFPKSALVWVFEHMSSHQQKMVKTLLMLPPNAGGMAMTRLRSNLISPRDRGAMIRPEARNDDPHHHGGSGRVGEEYLDLVRTTSGALEHRSRCYQQLAWFVCQVVARRFFGGGRSATFVLTNGEATVITTLILKAEMLHYYLEHEPTKPSMHGATFWRTSPIDRRYYKGAIADRAIPDYFSRGGVRALTLERGYKAAKEGERRRDVERYKEARLELLNDAAPQRLRLFKAERLGGWDKPSKVHNGTGAWLRNQAGTQLEVDVAACIDRLATQFDEGIGRWNDDAVKLVKAIASAFSTQYEKFRKQAQMVYEQQEHRGEAYKFLPSFRGSVDDLSNTSLWLENSWAPESNNYLKTQLQSFSADKFRAFRVYPENL